MRAGGLCIGQPPEWWTLKRHETLAMSLCDSCPAAVECLEDAISDERQGRPHAGIVGGLTERQRRGLVRADA